MRKLLLFIAAFICLQANAQVEFAKFKLATDNPMGCCPGRKMLDTKFKVTSERDLKYVMVDFYIVNPVGDVISGVDEGVKSDNEEFIKPKTIECTGPYESGKSYSRWISGVSYSPVKGITAFPYQVRIMYAGEKEWVKIAITKDNITKFFPKLKWMEINRYNTIL